MHIRTSPRWLYLSALLSGLAGIVLSVLGHIEIGGPLFILALWQVRLIQTRSLKYWDKKLDRDLDRIAETTAVELSVASSTPINTREAMEELWERSIWLAKNFKELWPGQKNNESQKRNYLSNLESFGDFLTNRSINMASSILEPAHRIHGAIREYKIGKDLRWTPPFDPDNSLEGGKMMSAGAKGLNKAIGDLRQAVRDEIGVE